MMIFQGGHIGLVGLSKDVPNQVVFSDSAQMLVGGADLAIDVNGNVDLGYKLASSPPPTPSYRLNWM